MTIERIDLPPREVWLELRKQYVGASDVASLFGLSPWKSAFGLYQDKTGAIEPFEETKIMKRGRHAEKMILSWLAEDKPDWKIEPGVYVYIDAENGIGCTPDAIATDDFGRRGIVQCKTIAKPEFDKKWRDGDGYYAPLHYQLQTLTEAMLTGAEWAVIVVMVLDAFGSELVIVPVEINSGAYAKVLGAVKDFWRRVRENDPPPVDGKLDGDVLAELYPQDSGHIIDFSHDNRAMELVHELKAAQDEEKLLKEQAKPLTARISELKTELKAKIKDAAYACAGDWIVTCKTINVKPTIAHSYRRLSLKARGARL